MKSKERPYILYVAETIYSEISLIKNSIAGFIVLLASLTLPILTSLIALFTEPF